MEMERVSESLDMELHLYICSEGIVIYSRAITLSFQNVRLVVDFCKSADVAELEDGTPPEFDDSSCQAHDTVPPFNEYLNVNAPLQLGGLYVEQFDPTHYHWQYMPVGKGFDGCIKNVFHNSKVN